MRLFKDGERAAAEAIAALNYTNPFMPERITLEKTILGAAYRDQGMVWNVHSKSGDSKCNIDGISARAEKLTLELNARLRNKQLKADKEEFQIYEDVAVYHLFEKYRERMTAPIYDGRGNVELNFYADFENEMTGLLKVPGYNYSERYETVKTFEIFYQVHRAFYYIFDFIIGSSLPMAELRAAIWQSIFTHDIHRYNRSLYKKMHNITTLITGESGTGKELVAYAVAMSQYIQFDPARKKFKEDYRELFHPLHLSAMPHTLIESELFGHKKGAYTGALQDRIGWMELCSEFGTVFLDEIGEINEEIQVKLLRLLQSRKFQRLGETEDRGFKGKIIAATNRNLAEFIRQGRFRSDLYYRLCADIIETPTLRQQLAGSNQGLENLVHFLSVRIIGRAEADDLAEEALSWIKRNLGTEYPWPGNVRELEQCVRNILIRGQYSPSGSMYDQQGESLTRSIGDCSLTADELLNLYCAKMYQKTGSYQKAAQLLELDRRTVKKRIDSVLE
jgi:hypothetical protein